jgi:transcription-repair coupling factor (superfamily II helicase)
MPRLIDYLSGYPPFETLVERATSLTKQEERAQQTRPEFAPAGPESMETGLEVSQAVASLPQAGADDAQSRAEPGPASSFEAVEVSCPSHVHAFVTAGLLERRPWNGQGVLLVAPGQEAALELEHELGLFCPDRPVVYLPPRGVWYGSEGEVKPRVAGRRARAVGALDPGVVAENGHPVLVVEAATLMEAVVPPIEPSLSISVESQLDFEAVTRSLARLGYVRVDQVEDAGEFSVRGGIIDIFPTTERYPVRVEFWGDEVESLRSFSVFSQRSLGPLKTVHLYASAEEPDVEPVCIASLLAEGTRVVRMDPTRAYAAVDGFQSDLLDVLGDRDMGGWYVRWSQVEENLASFPTVILDSLRPAVEIDEAAHFRATSGDLAVTSIPEAEAAIGRLVEQGYRVVVAFEHRAEADRAQYVLGRVGGRVGTSADVGRGPGVTFLPVPHRRHYLMPELKLALLTEAVVFPRRHKRPAERRPLAGLELSTFRDLRKGDFVVHEDHGVGRFEGISTKTVAGITRDYLDIAYRDGDMLYIPHDQIIKVMRYVGAGAAAPALAKLGGKSWEHVKSRARKAAREVAGELLHLYALRQATSGHSFSEDGEWQVRFEKSFPYEETEDQLQAIDVVKDDMESEQPMDRLLCGDVGYGKTEVALRAAFKATVDGRQVMLLVPTTILAQQHYGTFRERFADYPVKVEMLSRFRSAAEQKKILKDFAAGKIDVLIGTHRLLSQDVVPKDLGLVIVDEEQRFGVAQKEMLRRLKLRVDVLTLSATPIPRTLQMSLSGVRDISVIETPPRDRHPIQTYVGLYDEGMVNRAIGREIGRGGQVYYLHNRVETIGKTAARLRELMPQVRFAVAHGQMPEQELERVMLEFLRGDADVLVTTTIIESGLDIPNANTLIVERADLLGLAQLYQIRGRIGRSARPF